MKIFNCNLSHFHLSLGHLRADKHVKTTLESFINIFDQLRLLTLENFDFPSLSAQYPVKRFLIKYFANYVISKKP